jgi:hypothetical protein
MKTKFPLFLAMIAFSNFAYSVPVTEYDEDAFSDELVLVESSEENFDLFEQEISDSYGSDHTMNDQHPMQAPEKPYHQHYSVYGDFLYWQPMVNDSYWGIGNLAPNGSGGSSHNESRFRFDWDAGFRIGAAFKTTWEDITFDLNWTRFHTTSTNSKENQTLFTEPDGSFPRFSLYALPYADFSFGRPWKIQAIYKLDFDQIDFTFKRAIDFSKNFTLSPFGGARGVIAHYSLNSTRYSTAYGGNPASVNGPFNNSTVNANDNMKSIGLLAGLNANLLLGYGFGFYFGGDFFVGYGTDKADTTSSDVFLELTQNVQSISQNTTNSIKTMFDLSTGFSWNRNFFKNRMNLLFSAGYEFHVLNQSPLFLYDSFSTDPAYVNEASKTTAFQGLTIRGGIGF